MHWQMWSMDLFQRPVETIFVATDVFLDNIDASLCFFEEKHFFLFLTERPRDGGAEKTLYYIVIKFV